MIVCLRRLGILKDLLTRFEQQKQQLIGHKMRQSCKRTIHWQGWCLEKDKEDDNKNQIDKQNQR